MIHDKYGVFVKWPLLVVVVLNFVILQITTAQEVFVQTGFEEFATGNPPKDWEVIGGDFEVSGDTAKTDKTSTRYFGRWRWRWTRCTYRNR